MPHSSTRIKPANESSFENLGRAFTYPLQSAAMTSIVSFSFALMLGSVPVVGIALSLVVWATAYRYAMEVLDRTAGGSFEAPDYVMDVRTGGGATMLGLQLTFLALQLVIELWVTDGAQRLGLWLVLAVIQPAATINLVLIGNIGGALNPIRWLQLIGRIGLGYAWLVLVGSLCYFLQGQAHEFLNSWLPAILARTLAGLVAFYFLVVNFHLMGRIVFSRRGAIGHDLADVRTRLDPADRHRGFMRDVELLIADDKGQEAATALRQHLLSEPHTTDAMHQRYRRLLEKLGDNEALAEHTQTYASRLLAEKHEREALSLVRSMLHRDTAFRVRDAEQRAKFARNAMHSGMADVALALAGDFHRAHPKHKAVPEMALLGGRLLVDRRADTRAAREVLQHAADRFPDDPLQPEIVLKIEQIDALEARLPPTSSH